MVGSILGGINSSRACSIWDTPRTVRFFQTRKHTLLPYFIKSKIRPVGGWAKFGLPNIGLPHFSFFVDGRQT